MSNRSPNSQKTALLKKLGQPTLNLIDKVGNQCINLQENIIIKPIENITGIKVYDVLFGWLPTEEDRSLLPPKPDGYVLDKDYDPIKPRRKIVDQLIFRYKIYGILIVGLLAIGPRFWGSSGALALWMGKATPIINQVAIITRKIKLFERGNEHERRIAYLLEEEFSSQGVFMNAILKKNRIVSPEQGEIDIVLSFLALRKSFLISVKSLQDAKYVYFSDDKQRLQYKDNGVHYWKEDPIQELLVQLAGFQKDNPELRDVVSIVVIGFPTPVKVWKHLREQIDEIEVLKVKNVYVVEERHLFSLIHFKLY